MATVECPVCTLYLRADMSLEEHLETHPKDKVIKALVSMTKHPPGPSAQLIPATTLVQQPPSASTIAPNVMELNSGMVSFARSRTPPNALMYHPSGGYENVHQVAPQPPPPPPPPPPTAITVVNASDVGYPINNVMIVKSCSAKFVQHVPSGGNSSRGASTTYATSPLDGRSIFIEPDRGGVGGGGPTAAATTTALPRRQLASSLYPRYTNERYSGPPPPYSTAISSTISAGSQQQSTITGFTSKYDYKSAQQYQQQQTFYPNPPPAPPVVQTQASSVAQHQQSLNQQQQIYQPAAQPPTLLSQPPPPSLAIQQHQQQQLPFSGQSSFKSSRFLQAQYTEKDDGNFVVTENPKKVVEYTENDEGGFMVIEKIIKSPPRIVQATIEDCESASSSKPGSMEVQQDDYEMMLDEEIANQGHKQLTSDAPDTIQIVENDDGTFDDNQASVGIKEMPKPMLTSTISSSSTRKCNKFNLIVESSSPLAGGSSSGPSTPRKKPTSGLKVLSNVKVTTDLSQGIKDIILNLNSKSKAFGSPTSVGGNSATVDEIKSPFIAGAKPAAAVVNNNCQNELIINTGSNMPPIDLNNINDIEIINDDEDARPGEDEECYVGSMEVKATTSSAAGAPLVDSKDNSAEQSVQHSLSSASCATPTPSVITSVIRMTPHPSPVVPQSPPPPPPVPVPSLCISINSPEAPIQEKTAAAVPIKSEPISRPAGSGADCAGKRSLALITPNRRPSVTGCGSGFNKPPKKLTLKLKTPLPPAPPPTPPLVPMLGASSSSSNSAGDVKPEAIAPKEEYKESTANDHSAAGSASGGVYKNESIIEDCKSDPIQPTLDGTGKSKCPENVSEQIPSTYGSPPAFINDESPIKASSPEDDTSSISTKIDPDAKLSDCTVSQQEAEAHSSANDTAAAGATSDEKTASSSASLAECKDNTNLQVAVSSPDSVTQLVQTTTTAVEFFKITFIDDDTGGVLASQPMSGPSGSVAAHEVVVQSIEHSNGMCCTAAVNPEMETDLKGITEIQIIEIAEVNTMAPCVSPSVVAEGENASSPASVGSGQIKVEKIDKLELSQIQVDDSKQEKQETKPEPTQPSSSNDKCDSFLKEDKDFLEAGPSRANTVDDGTTRSGSHSNRADNNQGPSTFLEYNAEYDDYVPVGGFGIPQEQIPLSWVQKFSPQYTPFDDQNSYMDLDMCSKTNSNSVGGNSATCASGGSGSSASRVDTSMDRAPSAESLNIRTDEKMPAKGEISEQESNGDMELSWNRLYPVHENIPIYPSSYDLSTAQECWNLSNRHTGHNHTNNSSSSSTSNNFNLGGPSATVTGPKQENHLSPHQQFHQPQSNVGGSQSHGISFQFAQQHKDADDQVDDKSKINLDYGPSSSGASYLGFAPGGSGSVNADVNSRKLAKVRNYRCPECPKSFALLKQRRAHMIAAHQIDSKANILSAVLPEVDMIEAEAAVLASGTATTATASAATSSGASSTVTSGAALAFLSSPGEGCSTAVLNKKIKFEPTPMLMSYSSLKQELEQKLEIAGPSTAGFPSVPGELRRKRTYVCGTCKEEFDRFKLFNAHLMAHPAECYTCGRTFKNWPNFALHIKRHLGIKDHQCRLCGKKFVIKQKLIEHMRVHTGKAPIKCPDCDQHFRRFSNLAQHRNRHHLNKVPSKKDFVCHCGEVFQSRAKMEWHKEIHDNKPKSCPFCREKFIHKNSLTRHIRLSHTEKYVKLETGTEMCTVCHQPYIKTSMKRHMETHTDERLAYSCSICNKLFSTNWNLKQHKWTHANPTLKPFQCNMCSSGFVREADYITHMNAHRSIRPYTCNHCGCQFIRKYNWIRHTREHEMDKNYTCEICGRKFHRKYYLTEHKRIHTGERPFSCNICGKTSSTKTNHNKHIKIHHARDPLTAEG